MLTVGNAYNSLARPDSAVSNELFDTLAEWNTLLEHRKPSGSPVPPCP